MCQALGFSTSQRPSSCPLGVVSGEAAGLLRNEVILKVARLNPPRPDLDSLQGTHSSEKGTGHPLRDPHPQQMARQGLRKLPAIRVGGRRHAGCGGLRATPRLSHGALGGLKGPGGLVMQEMPNG